MLSDPKICIVLVPLLLIGCVEARTAPPQALSPAPSRPHLAWQRGELTMFLHFGVNTFTDREWGEGTEDPKIFDPTKLDARQWAAAAKAGGFKMAILTAKHHDGFCLWPSKYTEHSVKNSPWKNGKGDVVREFVDAFRAEGIKVGLYLSPWDRQEKTYGDSPKYNDHYVNQLTELLTNYGPISEVWFDGACGEGPNGKKQVYDFPRFFATVRKLQPDALMFSDAGPDIRWIGNEAGTAGDPNWSTVDDKVWVAPGKSADGVRDPIQFLQHGNQGGVVWRPGECDVSIRPGWFWHRKEDEKVRSVDNLMDLYFKSVGRNSLLLLNVPPNSDGLLSEGDVKRLAEFKAKRDEVFKTNLAKATRIVVSNTRAKFTALNALDDNPDTYWATDDGVTRASLEIDLGRPTRFSIAAIQENIALGQRIAGYRIECLYGNTWQTISCGTTIGYKKLDRFPTVEAQRVRLVIEQSLAAPTIASFALYQ